MTKFMLGTVALILVAAGFVPGAPVGPLDGGDAGDGSIKIGMVQGMFRDVQPAMVQALSKPLRDLIQKQTGLTGEVEIVPDALTLADRMKAKRYHLGVYHGFEFAWVQGNNPDLIPLVITVPPARRLQACVVVQKESKLATLADLKDDTVMVPRGTKAHCLLYLDAQRGGLPLTCAKPQFKPAMTSEEALDGVVQGDLPATLVDISAFVGYQNLQPGASKQLRMLCESELFPATVIAYRKGSLDENTVGRIRKLLVEAHQTPAGKPLMMLWNLKGFENVPADYSTQLDGIGKAYPAPTTRTAPAVMRTVGRDPVDK